MDPLPIGWTLDQVTQLHPGFVADLVPALLEADARQLRVRFRSGYRSNAEQKYLADSFKARAAAYDRGELKAKPLPAAPPGASAHNFALCAKDPAHAIRGGETCPKCGKDVVPAAVACDVQILDASGQPIPSGGDGPLEARAGEWQQWAAIVERHAALRDGGTFQPRADTVHVEWVRWNHKTRALEPERAAPAERVEESPAVTVAAIAPAPADATAVARPRRGGGRRGPPPEQLP